MRRVRRPFVSDKQIYRLRDRLCDALFSDTLPTQLGISSARRVMRPSHPHKHRVHHLDDRANVEARISRWRLPSAVEESVGVLHLGVDVHSGSRDAFGCRALSGSRSFSGCRCRPGSRMQFGCRPCPGSRDGSGCRGLRGSRRRSGCCRAVGLRFVWLRDYRSAWFLRGRVRAFLRGRADGPEGRVTRASACAAR